MTRNGNGFIVLIKFRLWAPVKLPSSSLQWCGTCQISPRFQQCWYGSKFWLFFQLQAPTEQPLANFFKEWLVYISSRPFLLDRYFFSSSSDISLLRILSFMTLPRKNYEYYFIFFVLSGIYPLHFQTINLNWSKSKTLRSRTNLARYFFNPQVLTGSINGADDDYHISSKVWRRYVQNIFSTGIQSFVLTVQAMDL